MVLGFFKSLENRDSKGKVQWWRDMVAYKVVPRLFFSFLINNNDNNIKLIGKYKHKGHYGHFRYGND